MRKPPRKTDKDLAPVIDATALAERLDRFAIAALPALIKVHLRREDYDRIEHAKLLQGVVEDAYQIAEYMDAEATRTVITILTGEDPPDEADDDEAENESAVQ